ncbi:MAG: hypothetical protein IK076_07575 [Bacteroidales bacterium]|nr:hypothetical protein [Bacteroidales bacterium]
MKRLNLLTLFLCMGLWVDASAATVSERVYLSTDKDVYVAGDLVWCSAFCFDSSRGKLSSSSSVAYIEIFSSAGTVVKGKVALIEGRGSGALQIPLSAPTGNYMIIGYTSAEKGRGDILSDAKIISVFSTLGTDRVPGGVEIVDDKAYSEYSSTGAKASSGNLVISTTGKGKASSSQVVRLENRAPSAASVSLSVHCDDGIVSPSSRTIMDFMALGTDYSGEAEDTDGEVFHGHLVGNGIPEDVTDPSMRGVIAFPGMANDVYVSRFNPDGTIVFKTVNVYGNRDMVCEVLWPGEADFRLVIDPPFLNLGTKDIPSLKLVPSMEDALVIRSKAMQVDRKAGADTLYDFMPKRESTLLSDTYCIDYHLDDYVRFPTVPETLIEITPELRVRKGQGGKQQLQVLLQGTSSDRATFTSDVLTMIDGVPVKDIQSLLDFDSMLLGDILIYPYTYQFGDVMYKGMVDFVTIKGDISSFKFDRNVVIVDWNGECYPVAFTCRNYIAGEDDLRGTLYWHPQIDLKAGEDISVEVRTPSYPGKFRIVAEGITEDGTPFRTETSFETD